MTRTNNWWRALSPLLVIVLHLSRPASASSGNKSSLSLSSSFTLPWQWLWLLNYLSADGVRCQRICPLIHKPVCASNGQTYSNECVFEKARCEESDLEMIHSGECEGPKPLPIEPVVFEEDCPERKCPHNYDPVCGTGNSLIWRNALERLITSNYRRRNLQQRV